MMRQFFDLKKRYPDVIMLIRCGDFYETFGEDALIASKVLGIILTKRASGGGDKISLAGVPYHAIQTELLTPGVSLDESLLQTQDNNFVAAVYRNDKDNECGVSFLDISTGDFKIAQGSFEYVKNLLSSFKAREVIVFQQDKAWFSPRLSNY